MNYRHQELFQAWINSWSDALEGDAPLDDEAVGVSLCTLYREYKKIETEVYQDPAIEAEYRKAAKEECHKDGELEIDSDAVVSLSEGGAYVESWLWVDQPCVEEDEECSPHDLCCNVCNVTLNNQCLDPDCTEKDEHVSNELCANCDAPGPGQMTTNEETAATKEE